MLCIVCLHRVDVFLYLTYLHFYCTTSKSYLYSCVQYLNSLMILSISTAIVLPSADSRRVDVSYKQKYVHEVLVNHLVMLAQEKFVVG